MLWALVLLVVLTASAVGLFVYAKRELSTAYRILSREPDAVLDTPAGGPVELEGVVAADKTTLESPFTGTDCVAYEYAVEERRTRTSSTGNTTSTHQYWKTIASGEHAVAFRLEDDTGSVLVDPTRATFSLSTGDRIRVDGGTEPPARIARFIDETDRVDDQNRSIDLRITELKTGRDRRFVERRLDVGGAVHVLGVARYDTTHSTASGQVNGVVGAPPDAASANRVERIRWRLFGPAFRISDTSARSAGLRLVLPGVVSALFGLLMLALALMVLSILA